MIVGIGIDICSIPRMRRALERHGERFFDRICSPNEKKDLVGRDLAVSLAGRFAGKEAFTKAIGGGWGIGWHEVEIRREESGRPRLDLTGGALLRAREKNITRWHVSLSHDAEIATAMVVLEGGEG